MTIIAIKHQLMQFFNDALLEKMARRCGFTRRLRCLEPRLFILALIQVISTGNITSISHLHQQINGLMPEKKHRIQYRPFYNHLKKSALTDFVKILVRFAIAQFVEKHVIPPPKKFQRIKNVLLQDGSSFKVHSALSGTFAYRFSPSLAAVECHMTLYLFTQVPTEMTITADTASERAYLPAPEMLRDQLLLADAGYADFAYFQQVSQYGGSFIVRGGKSLNPLIIDAKNGQGKSLPKLRALKLKDITRRKNRSEVLDLTCRRDGFEFRIIRRWVAEERRYCLWLTNLSATEFTADDIMVVYRCRWQVELLFNELKSHTNWRSYATRHKSIVENLIWLSLLGLLFRRSLARRLLPTVSLLKAANNTCIWLRPILSSVLQKAWSEIIFCLEEAKEYLSQNAFKTPQRKVRKNMILDECFKQIN
ncbi:IS4 family transposase [Xenorhabdus cabanillasii]|nr:IS4 family transposase [Xenorhabdus cabanillasii]